MEEHTPENSQALFTEWNLKLNRIRSAKMNKSRTLKHVEQRNVFLLFVPEIDHKPKKQIKPSNK